MNNDVLLWFDDGKDGLEEQIKRALERFEKKFGRPAEHVKIRSSRLSDPKLTVNGIRVDGDPSVLIKDIWVW